MPHLSLANAEQLKKDLQARKAKDQVSAVSSAELRKDLQLKKLLGRGGFAAVFLGTYKGEEVAVKILLAEHMQPGNSQVSLLLREGQYMSRCTHGNIVKCHAVCQLPADFPGMEVMGHTGSTWALVLEYIPGGSMAGKMMKQMSQTGKAYSTYEAYCWVRDVAEALSYLHNAPRPVMHRDVKADNVLLTFDPDNGRPTAKLMDFGLMAPLDGKNPLLRRRSINPLGADGLSRGSAMSLGRPSLGAGGGGGNLAAPSVATYYNDSTHEPGKIFYLLDELPAATAAALNGPTALRRASMDYATAHAAAGGSSLGGTSSPNSQFGFTAVASRGSSFEGGASTASGAATPGGGGGGGVPWSASAAAPPLKGPLVPLNEEASYHGNTTGYVTMLQQQQQQRQQQRAAQRSQLEATAAAAAVAAKAAGGGGGSGPNSGPLPTLGSGSGAATPPRGGGGAAGGAARALPSRLLAVTSGPPGSTGQSSGGTPAGRSPEDSPSVSGRWPRDDALGPGGVRLRMLQDDPSNPTGGAGAGGAPLSRGSVESGSGAVVRMTRPPTPVHAAEGYADEIDVISQETSLSYQQHLQQQQQQQRDAHHLPPLHHDPAAPQQQHSQHAPDAPQQQNQNQQQQQRASRPPSAADAAAPVIAIARGRHASLPSTAASSLAGSPATAAGHLHSGSGPWAGLLGAGPRSALYAQQGGGHEAVPSVEVGPEAGGGGGAALGAQESRPQSAQVVAAGAGGGEPALLDRQESQKSIASVRSGRSARSANGGGGGAGTGGGGGGRLLHEISISAMLQGRYEQDFQWVWRLTGQTGSCVYMAPEVFRNMPYNERADTFSFGVLLYEIFSRTMLLLTAVNMRELRLKGADNPEGYAAHVADGYRPAKPLAMPAPLYQLIEACWHQDPCMRPNMADVAMSLRLLQEQYAPQPPAGGPGCGCVIC